MKKSPLSFLYIAIILLFISTYPAFSVQPVSSFIYQLQNTNYEKLLGTEFEIGVIDWEDANLSPSQLMSLQGQGKKIVTYLSIGEAENYRDYWTEGDWDNDPPDFLEGENPEWPGNYKVEFWNSEWQNIIFEKINRIIQAGYDGVYLDIIDAYYYFEEQGRKSARDEMIDFVKSISERAKSAKTKFLIIPQNSPELIEDENYLLAIDGLGKEDTWFNGNRKRNKNAIMEDLKYLDMAIKMGKFILAIDYPTSKRKKCEFIRNAKKRYFTPFVSNRSLNQISNVVCNR